MKRKYSLWVLPILCFIGIMSAFADSAGKENKPTVKLEITGEPKVGNLFYLEYMLHFKGSDSDCRFIPKQEKRGDTLKILFSDKTVVSSSFRMLNGKISQYSDIKWVLTVKANKPGRYTTPDYVFIVSGDTLDIPCVKEEIIVKEIKEGKKNRLQDNKISKLLEIKGATDKNEIALGDSLTVEYKLYTTYDGIRNLIVKKPFEVDGCYFESLPADNELSFDTLDGKSVAAAVIARYKVIPLHRGSFLLSPLELIASGVTHSFLQDPFWGELGEPNEDEIIIKKTNKLNFKVK